MDRVTAQIFILHTLHLLKRPIDIDKFKDFFDDPKEQHIICVAATDLLHTRQITRTDDGKITL